MSRAYSEPLAPERASQSGQPVALADSYRHCRALTARHGRSYHLATRLLPAERRPAVLALYGFARTVDDLVDHPADPATTAAQLDVVERDLALAFDVNGAAPRAYASVAAPVLPALADTARRYRIPPEHFAAFLTSMRMDVPGPQHRSRYRTMAELREYTYGSAAVIGAQLLPILGTVGPRSDAEPAAAALGEAFQLTNFLRDVGEDLDRDRIYLPAADLAAFGVDEPLLRYCRRTGRPDQRVRRALAHLIAANRAVYRTAEPGIALLTPAVRPGIRAAHALYRAILDRIEDSGYAVFDRRLAVPRLRRAALVAAALV
ncbi:MAG: phytoene/squalene synthase family protein [Mycobacteriaceae bacterium]|nr:phytoene/squalene synthase family protein [Mycobacteriaceae bacterium]